MEEVVVLLSSYNGEKYIEEQIKSIFNQKEIKVKIIVRDDGSSDGTLQILKKYESDNFVVISGQNIGYKRSYMKLVELAPPAKYYAFADQDDVWHEDKIISAVEQIQKYDEIPAIYSSSQRLVDADLSYIGDFIEKPITELGAAIIKNYVVGCTTIFNQKLMLKIKEFKSERSYSHDWLSNMIALALGGVSIYDQIPHIDYRQHNNNSVGAEMFFLKKWKRRIERFFRSQHFRDLMCSDILTNYGEIIDSEEKELLEKIRDYKEKKVSIFFDKRFRTAKISYKICFIIMVICGRL